MHEGSVKALGKFYWLQKIENLNVWKGLTNLWIQGWMDKRVSYPMLMRCRVFLVIGFILWRTALFYGVLEDFFFLLSYGIHHKDSATTQLVFLQMITHNNNNNNNKMSRLQNDISNRTKTHPTISSKIDKIHIKFDQNAWHSFDRNIFANYVWFSNQFKLNDDTRSPRNVWNGVRCADKV